MRHPYHDPRERYQNAGYGSFAGSLELFANLIAVILAYFLTPELHSRTIGFVQKFTTNNYGSVLEGAEGAVDFIWWIICALLVFAISRMSATTLILTGGLTLAARFL